MLLMLALLAAFGLQAKTWKTNEVRELVRRVNTYWQQNNKAEVRSFWDNAAYHTGNMEVYKLLKDKQMLDYSIRWAEHNQWMGATEADPAKWKYKRYGEGHDYVLFGDWQICFQTYIDLYVLLGDESKIKRAMEVMGYEADSKANDYWWWADALYMVMPVMTKMYRLTGDEKYLDKLYENLLYSDSIMLDQETGLYFRDGKYVYPKHKSANGKRTSGRAATDGCWPVWPRFCRICPRTTSASRSSCISSRGWPVPWPNVSSRRATGRAPCSTPITHRALRPAERLSSATDCCGESITDVWIEKSLPRSSSGHGNTSLKQPCRRAARWAMCSPSANGPFRDRPWMPTARPTLA